MKKQLFEELAISDEIKSEAENLAKVILADSKVKAEVIKKNGFDNVLKNEFIIIFTHLIHSVHLFSNH